MPLTAAALCIPGATVLAASAGLALAGPSRVLDRAEYEDRLRAMWLGEVIANWTGLRTEGMRREAPFLTDADWGTTPSGFSGPIVFVTWQNPWGADDDTDIEYVYLSLLTAHEATVLTPAQIAAGWIAHINGNIWVSNASARALMTRGVIPPATGMFTPNSNALMIDAQLTTEFFGALAPGAPARGLAMADVPIRTTACGYAADAARFYVVLYSLAAVVDRGLPPRDQAIWLVNEARRFLPDTSKAADVVDVVLADFLANPDPEDWERTRDLVHLRYQQDAAANGFIYRAWYESTVNFACGVIALLYGGLDHTRTVQIGTLSGWDSDNGTATMGGLVGLVIGTDALRAEFPGITLSDRFNIWRTRPTMQDQLPADAQAEDTFAMMAQRMLPIIDRAVVESGGKIAPARWLLPPADSAPPLDRVPARRDAARSANLRVRAEGGLVVSGSSVSSAPWCCGGAFGIADAAVFANAAEPDVSGVEEPPARRGFYSSQNGGLPAGGTLTLSVAYDRPVEIAAVRFMEGDHFQLANLTGGWFDSVSVEARIDGQWTPVQAVPSEGLDPGIPFQIIDFVLGQPVVGTGIRLIGATGGPHGVATATELDALSSPIPPLPRAGIDLNSDDLADIEDVYSWEADPATRRDLDGDGEADSDDARYLHDYLRWDEASDMTASGSRMGPPRPSGGRSCVSPGPPSGPRAPSS